MENIQKTIKTPKKELARMQTVQLGKILFNLEFIVLAFLFASVLSAMFTIVYYLLLLAVTLITLGTIYIIHPEFASWWAGGEFLNRISVFLSNSYIYVVPISIVTCVLSIVCLCFDKQNKHVARIVISSIILAISLIILIFKLVGGGF